MEYKKTILGSNWISIGMFHMLAMEKALKKITVDETLCTGCLACEIACVVQHEGVFGTSTARIHVVKREENGLDQPHVCILCDPAPCIESCPTRALYRDDVSGAILINSEDCIGCWICIDECPQGAITMHPDRMLALICDLCGGDPACVKRCATGAILFTEDVGERSSQG